MVDLTGELVVVTGASSGIGSTVASAAADAGATVVLVGRRRSALDSVLRGLGDRAPHMVWEYDLEELDGIRPWLEAVVDAAGRRISGLVHCAGISSTVPLRTLSPSHFMEMMRVNAGATAALLSAFLSRKVTVDGAAFVGCSSIAAHTTSQGLAAYASSKHAVESLVRTAALEGRSRGLRVNAVAPGYVATPMLDAARERTPGFEAILQRQFLGTIAPADVATACLYLLSARCKTVTGSVFLMDGGYTL